jgi:hypothetical protein
MSVSEHVQHDADRRRELVAVRPAALNKSLLTILCTAVVLVAAVNFISLIVECERLGGDAGNGYQKDGHFFVSDHGHTTEVDEAIWRRNRLHSNSVFVTHLLALLPAGYLIFQVVFPKFLFRGDEESLARTERQVRQSGLVRTPVRCGGRIGNLNFSAPLIRVALYSDGLWIKPVFMRPFGILSSEITGVAAWKGFFSKGIEISHRSDHVVGPVILFLAKPHALVTSLHDLIEGRARR